MAHREHMRPPDGEIAQNAAWPEAPEFWRLPPEYGAPDGGGACEEISAPPPEFALGLSTKEEPPRKKSKKRLKLVAALLASVMGFSLLGAELQKSPAPSAPSAAPVPVDADTAEGSVSLVLRYAELRDETVYYSYYPFMPDPNDPEKISGDIPLPIDVYARVSDEYGGSASPEHDPDVWMGSRGFEEYSISAQGLRGDLTLTLTAQYTENGEARKTTLSVPITANEQESEEPFFEIGYALTDGENVYYSYYVRLPGDEFSEEAQQYWPITVHPAAESADGQIAYGETDVWEYSRASQFAYEIRLLDATSGELTLKLTGEYEYGGEQKTIRAEAPIEQMPAGEAQTFLWIQDDGTAEIKGTLTKQKDDPHEYDLEPMLMYAEAMDAQKNLLGGIWSMQDPSELEQDFFEEEDFSEYVFYRAGPLGEAPEGAKYCRVVFYLRDRTNGYIYQMESNTCPLPPKRYPLGDERIEILVYNDSLDANFDPVVLDGLQINAADFTEYLLPNSISIANYRFTGWNVHVGNPFDHGYEDVLSSLFEEYPNEAPPNALISENTFAFRLDGNVLTKEMVERVPISADGVRYVNIHAGWVYTGTNGSYVVELDDGQGNVTEVQFDHPLYSEGFFCTFDFPQPAPPIGYYFDGWYDEEGNRVDFLLYYYSFTSQTYDEAGKFIGYGGERIPVKLIAHWESYT